MNYLLGDNVKLQVITTNFASVCITGEMIELVLEFDPHWVLEYSGQFFFELKRRSTSEQ